MSARVPPEMEREVMLAITEHLQAHGSRDWNKVRDRFPDILGGDKNSAGARRFTRWKKKAIGGPKTPAEARIDATRRARGAVKRNIPAAPMPAAMLAGGRRADQAVDMMAMMQETMADILMVRANALSTNEDGTLKVKNYVQFDASIKRRMDIVNTYLAVFREIYDLKMIREFYDEIVAIIVEEIHPMEPEIANRITRRLAELNARQSMTMYADAPS